MLTTAMINKRHQKQIGSPTRVLSVSLPFRNKQKGDGFGKKYCDTGRCSRPFYCRHLLGDGTVLSSVTLFSHRSLFLSLFLACLSPMAKEHHGPHGGVVVGRFQMWTDDWNTKRKRQGSCGGPGIVGSTRDWESGNCGDLGHDVLFVTLTLD